MQTWACFQLRKMRKEDAIYGGEMSAHHYSVTLLTAYSGMIPWMLVAELLSTTTATAYLNW